MMPFEGSIRGVTRVVACALVVAAIGIIRQVAVAMPVNAADTSGAAGAIAWAQQEAAVDDHRYDNKCLVFAEYAYNVSPHLPISYTGKGSDGTAYQLFQFLGSPHANDSPSNVPAGALVFFTPHVGSVPDQGHVGISLGGGQMISPLTEGSQTGVVRTAMTWVAPKIAGWWMPDSTWPGQPGGSKPGGWWIGPTGSWGPSDPRPSGETIQLGFQAIDNGNGGLDHVDFTTSTDNGKTWTRLPLDAGTKVVASDQTQYFAHFTLSVPTIIGADVYSKNGSFHLSPQGLRFICLQGGSCSANNIAYWDGLYGYGFGAAGPDPSSPPPGQGSAPCTAGTGQVALFVDVDFSGQCVVRGIGAYADPSAIGLPNDSISSVKVGGGINVELCRDDNFSNTCEWTTVDIPDLSTHSVGAKQISSVDVTGGYAQSGGCSPGPSEVALFVGTNYGGQCVVKEIGAYPDPGSIGIPNDSTSSVQVGSNVKVELCRDNGFSNTCEWIDQNVPDLSTHSVGAQQASSAQVVLRGGISLCDGTNYSGNCQLFSDGTTSLSGSGWANRARSVLFSSAYANHYHIVLWTGPNQTGSPYHADNSVPDLGSPYDGGIQSINIYPHTAPPVPSGPTPAVGTVLPSTTTSVTLTWNGADPNQTNQAHVWGSNGFDLEPTWATGAKLSLTNLTPGQYYWQTQSENEMGTGPWSDVWSFSINTAPRVQGGSVTVAPGTAVAVQVQAVDADAPPLTLSASNLPGFATFTDTGNEIGILTLQPPAGAIGSYNISVTASDGELTGTGVVAVTVSAGSFCPSAWTCSDIGGPTPAGGQSLSGGSWWVQGAGGDIWGTADQFHSVFQSMAADGTVSAHVTSQTGGDGWAKAGVMLRQSADSGAPYYAVEVTPGNGVVVQYREGEGAAASMAAQISGAAPAYLMVARARAAFSAYTSPDGVAWTAIPGSSVTLSASGSMLAGLAVASHAIGLSTVGFDSVSVMPGATPPGGCATASTCADVGSPDLAGSQSTYRGTWTVQAYGSDIWGTSDQFHFAWQSLPADGSLSAHVVSQGNTDGWAKAGVMLRQSADADAAFYALLVTPGNGMVVQYRTSRGASAVMAAQVAGAAPAYLQITRAGSTFTAASSSDGTTWTPIAGSSATLAVAGPMAAGLAAASHAASISPVVFDTVVVTGGSGFDFEDGTTDGWYVGWGNTVSVSNNSSMAFSGAHSLGIDVQGVRSWPAIDVQSGLNGLGPGSTITFSIYSPVDGPVTIVPYARDGAWNVLYGPASGLLAGWNSISWQLPATNGLQSVGFQINNDNAWAGSLGLDSVTWASRFDFEDGTTDGWYVGWGNTISLSNQTSTAYAGTHSLRIDVQGVASWPAVDVHGGLAGLGTGSTVTFHIYSPVDNPLTIVPYARDGNWNVLFGSSTTLAAGWNTVTWQLPSMTGLQSIGFQINNDNAWTGSLALDTVAG